MGGSFLPLCRLELNCDVISHNEGKFISMNKFIFTLRKSHRILTIPMILLMVLKFLSDNTAFGNTVYGVIAQNVTIVLLAYMAISGLFMYFSIIKMKRKKGRKRIIRAVDKK